MRFILKILYNSKIEKFEIEHSTKMFNANIKYPKKISPKHLRNFEGYLIFNMKAEVLENSWDIVETSKYLIEEFEEMLKWESINYLYRHYEKLEGIFEVPMINSIGRDNFYEIQLIDTEYPTYYDNGLISNKKISKLIYSFTFSAKDYIPLKSGSYLPSFYNLYKKSDVIEQLISCMEKSNYINRFDNLPTRN